MKLHRLQIPSALDITYAFSATQNYGKITSETDALSGEQVLYTYDSLNRLASAQTAGAGGWGLSYNYDGFGNLTDQNFLKGSVPTMHVAYNYLTNRQTGDTADANGNIGVGYNYDIENRLVQPGSSSTARYAYDAANKRVWRGDTGTGLDEISFWAGQKLATYQINYTGVLMSFGLTSTNVYFGSKLISKGSYYISGSGDCVNLTAVAADRLGSIGKFYPYGVERPSATTNDKEKFTGYFRDASTGLDYADQRYEQPGMGRFMTPDFAPSTRSNDPETWNKYAYVGGDPVNRIDRRGTYWEDCYAVTGNLDCGDGWGITTPDGCFFGDPTCLAGYGDIGCGFGYGTVCGFYPSACPVYVSAFTPGSTTANSIDCGGPPVQTVANQTPQCFAQLKYRSVDIPANIGGVFTHSFWYVQDRTGAQYIISGGRQKNSSGTFLLKVWVTPVAKSRVDNPSAATWFSTGLSSLSCDGVDALISGANSWATVYYDPALGPNSNTAARILGEYGHFFPDQPPGAAGWWTLILPPERRPPPPPPPLI